LNPPQAAQHGPFGLFLFRIRLTGSSIPISVVDPGFMVDRGYRDAPDPPPSPNQPRR
jgi:hypothetical protein